MKVKYDVFDTEQGKIVRVIFYYEGIAIYYDDHPFFEGMSITYPDIDVRINVKSR